MSLEDTLSNVSLYDAKKYFRKAQNVVFNYTEMEAKVREATNNEPWGASSTLMEYIAQGTYNLREREEILGMIFRRFTEKTASEWRQIYKALQLLDYLIKHGSERFIDDTRCSMSLIRMLESFHYVDSQGRDQGINVRTRAKTLTELLGDDDKIRAERKRARETSRKYKGVAGGAIGIRGNSVLSKKNKGISISADYDTDDDDIGDDMEESEPVENTDAGVLSASGGGDMLLSNLEDENIEFGEFQCAPPAKETPLTTANDPFGTFTSNASPYIPTVTSEVTPAIATDPKKLDPFRSLFSSAKENTKSDPVLKAAPINEQQEPRGESEIEKVTSGNDDGDADDLFGDFKASDTRKEGSKKNTDPNQDHGEIDLLSF